MKPTHPCGNPRKGTDCPDRHAGCAATCPKWAKYVEEKNIFYEERIRNNSIDDFTRESIGRHKDIIATKHLKLRRIKKH